jgi:hypothetical protein
MLGSDNAAVIPMSPDQPYDRTPVVLDPPRKSWRHSDQLVAGIVQSAW